MKLIGVVSGKGGVGKTTTVANLAMVLARDHKRRVLAVDGNILAPNLGLHFGIYHYEKTLTDVVRGAAPIEEAIQTHPSGVHILPATPALFQPSDATVDLSSLLRGLKDYDYVLIDTAPSPGPVSFPGRGFSPILEMSDEVLVVTNPEYPSVVDAKRAIEVARSSRVQIRGVVLNRYHKARWGLSPVDVQYVCEIPVVSVIPDRNEVGRSISAGVPVVLGLPRSPASVEFRRLASFLQGESYREAWSDTIANFLWHRRRVAIEGRLRKAPVPSLPPWGEPVAPPPVEKEISVVERPLVIGMGEKPPPPPLPEAGRSATEREQVEALLWTLERQRERGHLPEAAYRKMKERADVRLRGLRGK